MGEMGTEIRRTKPVDVDACVRICVASPEYFSADVPEKVRADLEQHDCWALIEGDTVAGFVVVDRRSDRAVELLWAAVAPDRRGTGLGSALLSAVLDELTRAGVALVEVKTLDSSADYPPYEATRAFWERHGFVQLDTIDPLPGWSLGNPAAIYVAGLTATR